MLCRGVTLTIVNAAFFARNCGRGRSALGAGGGGAAVCGAPASGDNDAAGSGSRISVVRAGPGTEVSIYLLVRLLMDMWPSLKSADRAVCCTDCILHRSASLGRTGP